MSRMSSTLPDSTDEAISSKVKDIIENQWGKCVVDVQDIYVGQFYERLTHEDGQVSYRPTNRYRLRIKLRYEREARQTIFVIA